MHNQVEQKKETTKGNLSYNLRRKKLQMCYDSELSIKFKSKSSSFPTSAMNI